MYYARGPRVIYIRPCVFRARIDFEGNARINATNGRIRFTSRRQRTASRLVRPFRLVGFKGTPPGTVAISFPRQLRCSVRPHHGTRRSVTERGYSVFDGAVTTDERTASGFSAKPSKIRPDEYVSSHYSPGAISGRVRVHRAGSLSGRKSRRKSPRIYRKKQKKLPIPPRKNNAITYRRFARPVV